MVQQVVIYARVSTDDQDCQRQVLELTEFATRCGYEVLEVVYETGSGANNERPGRKRVLELARLRKINMILVSELSRWGRSTEDLLHTLQQLADWKCSLKALNGMELDMSTATGKLMVTLLAGVSEFERGLLQERIKSGLVNAKAKGVKLGRPSSDPYIVRVLNLKSKGESVRSIASSLKLSPTTVQSILKKHGASIK